MKKLYWVICNFEKQKKVSEIDFEGLNRIANDSGYEVEFAFISKENYCSEEEFDRLKKDRKRPRDLSAYLYSSNHTENECIYDALLKVSAERYFVCDARYLKHEDTIREMLEISSFYKMHFVRCKKDYDGIFATPVKFIKQTHNKVLGLVTNTKNEKYVRNFVVFNEEVLEYMKRNPINSAVIRETDMLFNANSENKSGFDVSILSVQEKLVYDNMEFNKPTSIDSFSKILAEGFEGYSLFEYFCNNNCRI